MTEMPAAASRALREAERYLDSLEMFGMRFGLERMRRLMTALDSPHERFRSIHVLGSNGKSSTVRMIAALLERHGLRSGAYLSPHLASWAERVEVSTRPVAGRALRGGDRPRGRGRGARGPHAWPG